MKMEKLNYVVTPGPEMLAKMGGYWTLEIGDGQVASFSRSEKGEEPGPVTLSLTLDKAAELRADGYVVNGETVEAPLQPAPDEPGDQDAGPGIDPIGKPEGTGGGDAGPGIDPIGGDAPGEGSGNGDAGPGIDPIGKPKRGKA
jgi:hypothetical protein